LELIEDFSRNEGENQMENTYTYTARSRENPDQVVTFTLQDHHMSVGVGVPMEQLETILQQSDTADQVEEGDGHLWLKPLAVSLLERGVGAFRVADVNAAAQDDRLRVSAWYRAGGLALAPVTLVNGPVDNPLAAQAFVEELDRRKSETTAAFGALNILNYWFTWILAGALILGLLQVWRRKGQS
jgi:hypothetical protein